MTGPLGRGLRLAGLAMTGLAAACGSSVPAASHGGGISSSGVRTSLATSLDTVGDGWALVPMTASPAFWEVFARPAASASWQLVTPPGVADNGGLVAAGAGGSLTVAVRPSQGLTFSPLATSADGGTRWTTGLIDASIAANPGALAASGSKLAALLTDGTVLASSDSGSTWRTLAANGTVADYAAGGRCGALGVTGVSFGINEGQVLAAGTCGTAGTGVFAYSGGGWRQVSLPVAGRVVRMMPGLALVASGGRLYAARDTGSGWPVSDPLPAASVAASGSLGPGAAWVLLPGRRAATIGGSAGQRWRSLPIVPAGTAVLAAGPGSGVDALVVSGSELTVWQLGESAAAWSKIQAISVPVQLGSSS